MIQRAIKIIDSHTGGEPTRIIVEGGPDLGSGSMAERRDIFARDHDAVRRSLVLEPRGSAVMVGALLCSPVNPENAAGVIFFNNAGYLNMCGHGAIGAAVTLFHLGQIGLGKHSLETPVGEIEIELLTANQVQIRNVVSYRWRQSVKIDVENYGVVTGDIAWAGNWFFLVGAHELQLTVDNSEQLINFTWAIRQALQKAGISGDQGAIIDHIELFAGAANSECADSVNFVLCPGREYDRSPCGTGTSAKMACLYADGKLQPGQIWRQQSIVGSLFEGSIAVNQGQIIPSIRGEAFVTLAAEVLIDDADPFKYGF